MNNILEIGEIGCDCNVLPCQLEIGRIPRAIGRWPKDRRHCAVAIDIHNADYNPAIFVSCFAQDPMLM
jgi:hypothetical protein